MAKHKMHNPWPSRVAVIAATALVAPLAMAPVFADTVVTSADTLSVQVGQSQSFTVWLVPTDGDGRDGCNAGTGSSEKATISFTSSNALAAAAPEQIHIEGCDNAGTAIREGAVTISVTGLAAGSTTLTATGSKGIEISSGGGPKVYATYATDSLTVNVAAAPATDSTPPVVIPSITGTLGNNDWYTSNVGLSWAVTDAQSAVTSTTGCGAVSVTADQAATTYTCVATSAGGTTTQTASIKRDATPPTVNLVNEPTDGFEGEVSTTAPTCTAEDASPGSGLAGSCVVSGFTTDVGNNRKVTASVSDNAGNTALVDEATYSVLDDGTAPVITPSVTGTLGNDGWYTSNVSVSFGVVEAETPSSLTTSGCAPASITADQGATDYSCSASSNGGVAGPVTVSVKRDATAPTAITFVGGPAASSSPYEGEVPAEPTCAATDALSDMASCTVSGYSTAIGPHTMTATAIDNAGNRATATRTYTVQDDVSPPTITRVLSGTASNGWYTSNVGISFTVTDPETPSSITKSSGCAAATLTTDTAGTDYTCEATSLGGQDAETVTVKRDTGIPSIADLSPTTAANGNNGWYTSAVVNGFRASDTLSGFEAPSTNPYDFTKSSGTAEGSAVTVSSGSVSDVAGNTTTAISSAAFKIDLTNPTVTCGAAPTFTLGEAGRTVSATVADSISGPAATAVTGTAATSAVGPGTAQVTGYDNAGRSTVASCAYSVIYPWSGFFQPIDTTAGKGKDSTVTADTIFNKVRAGSGVPVKFNLGGDRGLNIFAANYPAVQKVSCVTAAPTDLLEETTSAPSGLKYDSLTGQYNYTWKTLSSQAGTCLRLQVKFIDGESYYAFFNLAK